MFGVDSNAPAATLTPKPDANSAFTLPQISAHREGILKGFNNISIVTQKLRKGMAGDRSGSVQPDREGASEVNLKSKIRSASKRGKREDGGVKMSPKVLETWVNETL